MDIFTLLLFIHIAGGMISLLLGSYILMVKKGDKKHKTIGNIYFYSMLSSALISLPMSYLHPNYFLFIVGIFTSYMLLSGRRYLQKKQLTDVKKADWILTIIMFFFGIAFIVFGIYQLVQKNSFGTVFLVFGSISMLFVYQDNKNFRGYSKIKNFWLTTHIQRMLSSYIASVTAFLVVNNSILPDIVAWLLPTVVIVPLIVIWSVKYKILVKKIH